MKLIEPLNLLLDGISDREFALIEYDSISQYPLLPLKLVVENYPSIFVEFGDKLSVKIPALIEKNSGIYEKLRKIRIINVSNYKFESECLNICNIPLAEFGNIMSEIYSNIKEFCEECLIVLEGIEILPLYFSLKNILKGLVGLKITLHNSTIVCFVNYDVLDLKNLALLESISTTVVRFRGILKENSIERYGYVLKSLNDIKRESVKL